MSIWCLGSAAALFLLTACAICLVGLRDDRRPSDVAVVLGNKVYPGGTPSPRLAARLDEAVAIWRANLVKAVIVSGGIDGETDEAAAMRLYLIDKGVPRAAIFVDSRGTNTWETARNIAAIMKAHEWRTALIVSQYFHIARSALALRRFGILDTRSAHAAYFEWRDLYSIAREVVGYPKYWLRPEPRQVLTN